MRRAGRRNISAGTQSIDRVNAGIDSYFQLGEFRFSITKIGGGADVGIGLG